MIRHGRSWISFVSSATILSLEFVTVPESRSLKSSASLWSGFQRHIEHSPDPDCDSVELFEIALLSLYCNIWTQLKLYSNANFFYSAPPVFSLSLSLSPFLSFPRERQHDRNKRGTILLHPPTLFDSHETSSRLGAKKTRSLKALLTLEVVQIWFANIYNSSWKLCWFSKTYSWIFE